MKIGAVWSRVVLCGQTNGLTDMTSFFEILRKRRKRLTLFS